MVVMRHLSRRRLALDAALFLLLLGLGLALSRPAGPAQRPAAIDQRGAPAPSIDAIDQRGAPGAHTVRKGYSLYRRAPAVPRVP